MEIINEFNSKSKKIQDDYLNTIKENPESIFELVTQGKVTVWQTELGSVSINSDIKDDNTILSVIRDLNNQHIIQNDIKRTRVKESCLVPDFKDILECLLTYYCKRNNVIYKQGLNEIFGPLIFLKFKFNFTLVEIYNLAECFINKFLTNYYREGTQFNALNSTLSIFTLLLKYHVPNVYNVLDALVIETQTYATNWFLTTMASKLKLDVLYLLWENMIIIKDELLLFFIFLFL